MRSRHLVTPIRLLAIAAIVLFPHLGLLPNFGYTLPILLLVWLSLKQAGETFASIGFSFRSITAKAVLVGSLSAVAILGVMQLLVFPLLELFVDFESAEVGLYDFLRENRIQFLIMLVMGWLIGGFYEQIVFHGFLFTRLEKMLPGRQATVLAFALAALLFGAYHLQLGAAGALNALVVGVVYLGLFLAFRRNLWASIICHGVYNTLAMTLIYLGLLE